MLKWLERVADHSMTLDFPTGRIDKGVMVPHVDRLNVEGFDVEAQAKKYDFSTGYTACFIRTLQNNQYFASNRKKGATNFLNVIQGRNDAESQFWYNQVKNFPFEGWAFAGKHSVQLSITLRRPIEMRDQDKLKPNQYINFLGVSTLKVGAALTYIKRALNKHTDAKGVMIIFDSSSAVETIANGYKAVSGYQLGNENWHLHTEATN